MHDSDASAVFGAFPATSEAASDADRTDLMLAWASGADAVDDLALALTLWEQSDAPPERVPANGALALLVTGEVQSALALLDEQGLAEVPAGGPRRMEHVIAIACRAATGDPVEFSRLLAAGSLVPASARVMYLYALAVAAERIGHVTVADDAWRSLVVDHGRTTPLVLSRFVAAWVDARDRCVGHDGVRRAMQAAHEIRAATPRPWHDPVVLERAVGVLGARGDGGGAAPLVSAVVHTSLESRQLQTVVARVRPKVRRAAVVVPYALAACLALLGVPGMLLGVGVVVLSQRRWRVVPELSLEDERAWRGIERLRFERRRDGKTTGWSSVHPFPVLGCLLGLVVGGALASMATGAGGPLAELPTMIQTGVWLVWLVVLPAAGIVGGQYVLRLRDLSVLRARLASEDRARLAGVSACRCWETVALVGLTAEAHAHAHLRPASDVPPRVPVARGAASVLVCPLSGVRWLATYSDSGRSALLLRGTPPTSPDAAPVLGTGGYL